jgi:hypothetical protein
VNIYKFVFYTGIYNSLLAAFLLCPPAYHALGLNIGQRIWGWVLAAFLAYTAVTLIICSRNLWARAAIVYHEALLRFVAAALLIPFGIFGDIGLIAAAMGLVDAAIGYFYMQGLTKTLNVTHKKLFLDRL